jgi:predicted acyl esterase
MLTIRWQTSRRQFGIVHEKDVAIPVRAGFHLNGDVFRPDAPGRFPAILGAHPYSQTDQFAPMMPIGQGGLRGHIEAGDFNFYVRRGYVHAIVNLRGTGASDGVYDHLGNGTVEDVYDAIEWLAAQPWCDGNIGMLGLSYFAMIQKRVAALKPPHLKALFAPFGMTDLYRDWHYHGGIFQYMHPQRWLYKIDRARIKNHTRDLLGAAEYERRLAAARADAELTAIPFLAQRLKAPDSDRNPLLMDLMLNPLYDDYFAQRTVAPDAPLEVPAYLGSCWGVYGLHLAGDLRSWAMWKGPKKLSVGPPIYVDRPFYQYQYESLRWFDHWLKGVDTGIMDEPPVHVFIDGSGQWKQASEWPLPQTRWTPFYLHEKGLLSEHEYWPNEGSTTFVDSPFARESATFTTPQMVEMTTVCGPMVLNLYASTTGAEVLWFISILEIAADGQERLLTRGWLRGSQRRIDPVRSQPWLPYHPHTAREPLTPDEVYEFNIEVRPYGVLLKPGSRLVVRIKCCDDEKPANHLHGIGIGHVWSQDSTRVTIHHDADHPSHLLLPVIEGNRIGTYMSGGII